MGFSYTKKGKDSMLEEYKIQLSTQKRGLHILALQGSEMLRPTGPYYLLQTRKSVSGFTTNTVDYVSFLFVYVIFLLLIK
jgi:hypothetical protein